MATMKTDAVTIPLYGHGLECSGTMAIEPIVTGTFDADTITGSDGKEYAIFTIPAPENKDFPDLWAGEYRIDVSRLASAKLPVFV